MGGFDGVLNYLNLIGFESNAIGTKLINKHCPSLYAINTAMSVIDSIDPEIRPSISMPVIPSIPTMAPMMNMNTRNRRHAQFDKSKRKTTVAVVENNKLTTKQRLQRLRSLSDGISSILLRNSETECIDSEQQMVCIDMNDDDDYNGIVGRFG